MSLARRPRRQPSLRHATVVALAALGVAGCRAKKPPPTSGTAQGPNAASAFATNAPTATTPLASARAVEFEEISDPTFGYAIKIPKGAETIEKTDLQHTYVLVLSGGVTGYSVMVSRVEVASLESAVEYATSMGPKVVDEKREFATGAYVVVKPEQLTLREVFVFVKGKRGPLNAKCTGPATELRRVVEMCTSLREAG